MLGNKVTIYTDGACFPNPGQGGYGAVMIFPDRNMACYGGNPDSTNNRMEILAAIAALRRLSGRHQVTIYTDSQYLKQGITTWIKGWKENNWKRKEKGVGMVPVKNDDLWKALDALAAMHSISWHWVRGHDGNVYNEYADELANRGRRSQMEVYEPADYAEGDMVAESIPFNRVYGWDPAYGPDRCVEIFGYRDIDGSLHITSMREKI